jgi:hypothetical protein
VLAALGERRGPNLSFQGGQVCLYGLIHPYLRRPKGDILVYRLSRKKARRVPWMHEG